MANNYASFFKIELKDTNLIEETKGYILKSNIPKSAL